MTKQEFLAMSVPYELKMLQSCEHWYTPEPNRVVLLTGIADVDGKAPMQYGNEPTETTIFYRLSKDITGTDYVLRFKPILRPLSDLAKEVEHKGERFVPIEKLNELLPYGTKSFGFAFEFDSRGVFGLLTPNSWLPFINYFPAMLKLIEWHFDLFGGIENKEAINVNDLEINPYK